MSEIVLMNAGHTAQAAALEKLCFSEPWSERSLISELDNPLSLWLIYEEDGCVLGYIGSQTVLNETDMMNLAVRPDARRRGIGAALLAELCARLHAVGSTCLTLEVRASNTPAITLYTKFGFTQVGCRPGYYRNPREDALILRKELL